MGRRRVPGLHRGGPRASPERGAWALRDHVAFYPRRVDAARLVDERADVQPGDSYRRWITGDLVGPFKVPPGTRGW